MEVFPGAAVEGRIRDRSWRFVFPSQAAAEAWAQAAPQRFGLGAVEAERFLGWDRFKEELLSVKRREKPAERLARTVWAAAILARQAERPFLSRLAGPGKPSPAFLSFFSRLPPALKAIADALETETGGAVLAADPALWDFSALRRDYAGFLAEHGLFEPAWEELAEARLPPDREGTRYLLIAPELIEDFERYESAVSALPFVEVLRLPALDSPPPLTRYESFYEELRAVFLRVAGLLDAGMAPEDIAISVPELEEARPYFERASALYAVPLSIRSGRPLSALPFGRFLSMVAAAADSDFSFPAMRALLMDGFARFKDPGLARGLIRFGIEKHAYASFRSRGRKVDVWSESLALSGGNPALGEFYRRLRDGVRGVSEARDFSALRAGLTAFRNMFLDEEGWSPKEKREVQRIMTELEGLARAEEELGARGRIPSPLGVLLTVLSEQGYVHQAGGGAVSVYPYRVSALLPVKRHFIVGAGQDQLRVVYKGSYFLGEGQKEALGLADREASEDFLSAYLRSGEEIHVSYAENGLSGWNAAYPAFLPPRGQGAREAEGLASLLESDPLRAERAFHAGERERIAALLDIQRKPFEALRDAEAERSGAGPARWRGPECQAGEDAVRRIVARVSRPDGRLRLSASTLKEYRKCPFSWLLSRALGLESEASGIGFFDARLAGDMAHDVLRRLFESLKLEERLVQESLPAYLAAAEEALRASLESYSRREGIFLRPMFEAYAPLLSDRLERLLRELAADPGWDIGELELPLERELPGLEAVLEGRVDRLARRGEESAIVDYKKKSIPKAAEVVLEGGGTELEDFQIAAYVSLAEASGRRVDRVSYWSIEEAREFRVLGEGGRKPREDYEPELSALEAALKTTAEGLRRGAYGTRGPGNEACEGCSWKPVCRERYATE